MGQKGKSGIYLSRLSFFLITILIIINTILVINNTFIKKKESHFKKVVSIEPLEESASIQNLNPDLFDRPCPEVVAMSIDGQDIAFRHFAGRVIIIKFSRFYEQELPSVIYLQDLAERYEKYDTCLFFINSRGKHDRSRIARFAQLTYPVIEDDGTIRALFNANLEDTFIIGRDFKIKHRCGRFAKTAFFDELLKWACVSRPPDDLPSREEISRSIKEMVFHDVFSKENKKVYQLGKPLLLIVASSVCMTCEETRRFQLLKELAQNIDPEKAVVLLIFGKGNKEEALAEYGKRQGWKKLPVSLGVINGLSGFNKEDYFNVFHLNLDPKTYLIDSKGDLVFLETRMNSGSINLDLCMSLLK